MSQDAAFEKIMELVGNEGRFQNRFNLLFNGGMVFFSAMLARSFIISMAIPDHWCHVPGREFTNFTMDEWKHFTIPREVDTRGHLSFSKCEMYDVNWEMIRSWNNTNKNTEEIQKILGIKECAAYDYDKRWYGSTMASDQNWVCANDMDQTNTYAFNHIGDILGLYVFGRMGDKYGRRVVFFFGIATIVTGRILTAFSAWNLHLFRGAAILAAFGDSPLYFAPYVIAMEISKPDNRSRVAIIQCIFWTLGMSMLPFAFWIIREWFTFYIVCSLPLLLFYLIPSQMIESPRWLITQGNYKRAAHYLNRIAEINKKSIVITETLLETMMPKVVDEKEKDLGMLSLFSGWRLAFNTIVIQSEGNPFLNYFGQSMSELPAYFTGMLLIDRLGRRWANWSSLAGAALFSIPAIILCTSEDYGYLSNLAVIGVKFCTSVMYFGVAIQGTEMYPTCLRQTGFALCGIGSNLAAAISPYIAYLGQKVDMRLPIVILFVLFLFGCVAVLYLPETLHQKLPDSLEDARYFGKDQKIWSFPKKPPTDAKENNIADDFGTLRNIAQA